VARLLTNMQESCQRNTLRSAGVQLLGRHTFDFSPFRTLQGAPRAPFMLFSKIKDLRRSPSTGMTKSFISRAGKCHTVKSVNAG
jgi:hypothetical protein